MGVSGRERGYYAKFGDSSFPEFGYQRSTSPEKIEEALGRPTTDEEVDSAKENPFAADYVFCFQCEDKFGKIESNFGAHICPLIMRHHDTEVNYFEIQDIDDSRLFFCFRYGKVLYATQFLNSMISHKKG